MSSRVYLHIPLSLIVLITLALSACSAANSGKPTAGQLASPGKTVFQQKCTKCHGENGLKVNGSALLGPDNILTNYQTAQGLYNYISKYMPDDQPGSLTSAQYLQVVSYLLVQNHYVQPGLPLDPNTLERILLQK